MTLDTSVAIRLNEACPLTAREVLDKAVELLCETAGYEEGWGIDRHPLIEDREHWEKGTRRVGTLLGQGFYAITEVQYRENAPLYARDYSKREWEVEFQEERWHEYGPGGELAERADLLMQPGCMYELSMDSAYGTHTANGHNAWTLHTAVALKLQAHLIGMGGVVVLQDECSGEWFDLSDADQLQAGIASMHESGGGALSWFTNIVRPAVEAKMAAEGGGEVAWCQ